LEEERGLERERRVVMSFTVEARRASGVDLTFDDSGGCSSTAVG
jgi:hypothetical protein